MSYIVNLKNQKQQQKSKAYDNVFKLVLLGITLFVVFLIAFVFISLITKGFVEVGQNEDVTWTEILFGDRFDMTGYMAMGIIVFNTIWMAFLVLLIATPISVCTALFITKIVNRTFQSVMVAIVSILAAIPSVIYGSFGKYFILKFLNVIGLSALPTDATLLAVIIILSIMIMPTITLMSTTSIMMVDNKMEDSSEALGATKVQTSVLVTLRSAKTGIIIGMLFALGRCLGEATAISMLSGARPLATGITLSPFNTSLFMSPVIMSAFVGSTLYPGAAFTYTVMSGLLLLTIILLFLIVKFFENITDDSKKSKRQSAKAIKINNILKSVESEGQDSLNNSEIKEYKKYLSEMRDFEYKETIVEAHRSNEIDLIRSRSSADNIEQQASYKNKKSALYKGIIITLSMFGIIALISVLAFLFNTDLSLLFNWEYLTSKGPLSTDGNIYGLGIAMFGTMITIIVALSIAMPLGIAIAVYSHTYLNSGSKLANIVSFSFQIMTSIPAVIYGTLATILFVKGGFIREEAYALAPMLMLALVILPTIIKQTQEGFRNVKISQTEGSLALGSTKAYASRRIVISQSMSAILAAAILSISIVMADSAIFITIIGHPDFQSSTSDWMGDGGYTLATTIYWLSSDANAAVIPRETAVQQMKVIGIILMLLIFWLTFISQKYRKNHNISGTIMFIAITLFMSSFFIMGGSIILFIISIIIAIIGVAYDPIISKKGKR